MEYQIHKPLKESKDILFKVRKNSPRTRKGHELIIRQAIKALYRLRKPFHTIHEINRAHIDALIVYWKKLKLSDATIGNRLSVLRKYLKLAKHSWNMPSNAEFGCVRKKKIACVSEIPESIVNQIKHPLCRLIINLQIHFGLTKQEAIKFNIQRYTIHNQVNQFLFIAKGVSHSHKDRMIMLRTEEQKNIIHDLESELQKVMSNYTPSLADKYDMRILTNLYHAELTILGCSTNISFRSRYAKQEYQYLTIEEGKTAHEAMDFLSLTMHVSDRKLIKSWVGI